MEQRVKLENLKNFLKYNTWGNFVLFSCVGGFVTGVDFVTYFSLRHFFVFFDEYYLIANFFAFALASLTSFYLNSRYTFGIKRDRAHYMTNFFIVVTSTLVISECLLLVSVEFFGWNHLFSKVFANGTASFFNYFMNKMWTFRGVKRHGDIVPIEVCIENKK